MSVASCVTLLVAGLVSARLVFGIPVNGSNAYAVEEQDLASGFTLWFPDFLLEKRDDEAGGPEPPVCDRICVQRLLYQTAYSSVSTGMEYAMAVHKVPNYCFGEAKEWCPQVVDTKTTMIASRASYMNLDLDWCDDACLMVAMGEVAKQGALQGMKWVDEASGSDGGADPAEVDKLHWSMWYLTGASTSVDAAEANQKESPKPAPSRSWNSTSLSNFTANGRNLTETRNSPAATGLNSTVTGDNSTTNGINSTVLSGSFQGTNLLLPYITGGACIDAYLCHDNNKAYISQLLDKAASNVNGTTWLGFILTGAAGGNGGGSSIAVPKQTFPAWVKEAHCGGGGHCPTAPDVGPQRPPPNFNSQNIAPPPPNPYAPEQPSVTKQRLPTIQEQPEPEDEEDARHREEERRKYQDYIDQKCGNDKKCQLEEMAKADQQAKNLEEQKKEDKVDKAEAEDVQKAKDQEEADKKERQETCKSAPGVPKCEIQEQKKQDEFHEKQDKEAAKQEVSDRTRANDQQYAAKELCKNDEDCLNRERQRIAKEAKEEEERREANRKAYEEKCARDRACELEEARKLREQRDQELEQKRKDEEDARRHKACDDDLACHEREKANQEARKKARQKDKDAEIEGLRKQISGRRHGLPKPPPPEKPNLRGTSRHFPDGPEFRPFRNGDFDTFQRFRSSRYDTNDGTMRVGDLHHAPLVKQKVWDEIGRSGQPPGEFKLGRIILNNYEPFHVKVDGKDTGKVEWQHWEDLVRSADGSWLYGKEKSFKMSGGEWARNALGDPVIGGKPGDSPLRTEPIPGKRVRFEEYADYKIIDKDSTELLKPDGEPERLKFNPNQPLREQGNFKQFLQEGFGAEFDEFLETWKPKSKYNDAKHPASKLKDNVLNKFQTDGAGDDPDGPDGHPESLHENHSGGKDGHGKHKTFKTPHNMKIDGNAFIKQMPRRLINAGTAAGPEGMALALATAYGQEVFFLADAKGDWDVYWDCLKSRFNPWHVNLCAAMDAEGNPIEVEDKGPWQNFYDNTIGQFESADIDGDGHKENIWEKFIASMEDTGHQVKEFFVDGEDGKGFGENFVEGYLDVGTTMTDGLLKGVEWVGKTAEKAWHHIKKPFKWIGKQAKKFWNKLFG